MRAFWSGEIAFGLVTIPAKLYSATKDLTPQFHQLHKECGTRIQLVRRCPKCARDIDWGEIGKGYEVSKGEYALFTKEELATIEGEDAPGGIDIVEFVDPLAVDLAYIDKSYWVGPGGKSARGYELLRDALEKTKRVGLAKVKIRTRTRLGLLRPRGHLFALDMMRFADELVSGDEIVVPDVKKASPRELELALNLVETLSGPFDPSKHPDEYRVAVEAAVDEKVAADEIARDESSSEERAAATSTSAGGKVIDLAELLSRSLKKVDPKGGVKKAAPKESEAATEAKGKPGTRKSAGKDAKKRAAG
jgi:DNA end-binding protein Ku